MKVERTTTGVIIHEPTDEVKRVCLQYFSLSNPVREFFIYSGNDPDNKFIFKDKDVIYITSGLLSIKNNPVIDELNRKAETIKPPIGAPIKVESNREPRSDLQRDCIKKLTDPSCAPKVTVEAKPGTGKEEPYSRKIPTPTPQGYTLMGDLQVGDYVFDRSGRLTKILQIFEQGEKDVYQVTFQDGRTAYCGAEHLWTVKTRKHGAWKTVMLKDMLQNFNYVRHKYYIPTCQPVAYPKQETPIDPWVFGCFIGSEYLQNEILTISSVYDELPNKIADICGFKTTAEPSEHNPLINAYTFYHQDGSPVYTKDFFKGFASCVDSHRIPDVFMINDAGSRLKLLQGLMDADGSLAYTDRRYRIMYVSPFTQLCDQVLQLLYSFGYSGKLTELRTDIPKYGVIFHIPNSMKQHVFTLPSMKREVKLSPNHVHWNCEEGLQIRDIRFSHREKCRCIMVDNPEHLYLTEDYIVTHNTFMALYAIGKIGQKPLIIAPTKLLKNQWIDNLIELGIDKKDIATNIYDAPTKTFCVVTISSLENCMREDWYGLHKTLEKSRFGIKIIDEAHLHLKGVLKFDAICNIERNWYMSATLGRSDASEDRILNRALKDADRFIGNGLYEEYQKQYVTVCLQDIWYYPSAALCQKYFRYGSKGLVRATYYNMLLAYNGGKPFIKNILTVMKRTKDLVNSDKRILVLVPLREAIKLVEQAVKQDPYFKNLKVGTVDGTMSMSERSVAMESDIIISTSMSMGTGVDLQNLIAVINFDQYASPIITEQICGRLRDRGYDCYYVDICDHVRYAKVIENWGRKRRIVIPYFPGVKSDIKKLPNIRF